MRPSPLIVERYIDPEPLIALWPLRIAVGEEAGVVTTQAAPGVPHGAMAKHRKRHALRTAKRISQAPPVVEDVAEAVSE